MTEGGTNSRCSGLSLVLVVALLLTCCGCVERLRNGASRRTDENRIQIAAGTPAEQQEVIAATMADARSAVDQFGVSEAAVRRIEQALAQLAKTPGLLDRSDLRDLHGGAAASVVLATEGDSGLTLNLARFSDGRPTPIHDHGTWAVGYVVKGRDRYIKYERVDDRSDPNYAQLRITSEKVLEPGDSVHWFGPPHDIHSQQGEGGPAWELVLLGKNPMGGTLHYFDTQTGRITERKPQ